LFVCFSQFAATALYLRAVSADRRETFKHDWKRVILDNVGIKIGGGDNTIQFWGQLFFYI